VPDLKPPISFTTEVISEKFFKIFVQKQNIEEPKKPGRIYIGG